MLIKQSLKTNNLIVNLFADVFRQLFVVIMELVSMVICNATE